MSKINNNNDNINSNSISNKHSEPYTRTLRYFKCFAIDRRDANGINRITFVDHYSGLTAKHAGTKALTKLKTC